MVIAKHQNFEYFDLLSVFLRFDFVLGKKVLLDCRLPDCIPWLMFFLLQLLSTRICSITLSSNQTKYMVDLDIQIPTAFDPFTEAKESDAPGAKEYVHIRIQQRNGKKSLTTVQGLKKEFSYEKILKDLKKEFCCNGNVVQDKELGKIIQLQGDQRKNVSHFLVQAGLVRKDQIKIHGF